MELEFDGLASSIHLVPQFQSVNIHRVARRHNPRSGEGADGELNKQYYGVDFGTKFGKNVFCFLSASAGVNFNDLKLLKW